MYYYTRKVKKNSDERYGKIHIVKDIDDVTLCGKKIDNTFWIEGNTEEDNIEITCPICGYKYNTIKTLDKHFNNLNKKNDKRSNKK